MASERFPYGQRVDWSLDLQPAWLPAAAFVAWRAIADGRPWAIPLYGVVGYLLAILLRHASRHSPRGRVRNLEQRLENISTTKLLLISIFVVTPLAFAAVALGMLLWDAVR